MILRVALRSFSNRPGFVVTVVLSLALGIGANVAVFSLASAVLIEPLPFPDSAGLVVIWERNFPRERTRNVVAPRNFVEWREAAESVDSMAALVPRRLTFASAESPAMIPVLQASEGFFEILGVAPARGRVFTPDELRDGAAVAVITHDMWRGALASDPDVLGKPLLLEDTPHTVIGVMPPGFRFALPATSYSFPIAPMVVLPQSVSSEWREREGRSIAVLARLAEGEDEASAQAEMSAIAAALSERYPESNTGWGVTVVSLKEQVVGDVRATLLLLWGAVTAMLLIVAANVANLLLGRALGRRREIAIRTAMGARSGDIVRQLLVESLVLTSTATALGVALGHAVLVAVQAGSPIALPRLDEATIDARALLYALGASAVMTIVFGLAPAFEAGRGYVQRALREEGASTSSSLRSSRLRSILVVSEVALAVTLVAGAGLLLQTLVALRNVDTGFDRDTGVTLTVGLPDRYDDDASRRRFFAELLSNVQASPEIEAAGVVSSLPLTGPHAATSFWAGGEARPAPGEAPTADIRIIRGDYFRAMSIPLLAGRNFDERDGSDAPPRAIASAATVRALWPDATPSDVLGREIVISWGDPLTAQLVGVVGDVRHQGVDVPPRSMIYWPHEQNAWSDMMLVARAPGREAALPSALRALRELDAGVAAYDVGTLSEVFDASVADRRVSSLVLGLFAALALGLASLGVYGVVSFSAAARTREMSLRLALGATPSRVVGLVLEQGLGLVGLGAALGLLLAVVGSRFVSTLLYGVSPTDPVTLLGSVGVLLAVATLAAYLPARRASRLDPASALRAE